MATLAQRVLHTLYTIAKREDTTIDAWHRHTPERGQTEGLPAMVPDDMRAFYEEVPGLYARMEHSAGTTYLHLLQYSKDGKTWQSDNDYQHWGYFNAKQVAASAPVADDPDGSKTMKRWFGDGGGLRTPFHWKPALDWGANGKLHPGFSEGSEVMFFTGTNDGDNCLVLERQTDGGIRFHVWDSDGLVSVLPYSSFTELMEVGIGRGFTGWWFVPEMKPQQKVMTHAEWTAMPREALVLPEVAQRQTHEVRITQVEPLDQAAWRTALLTARGRWFDDVRRAQKRKVLKDAPVEKLVATFNDALQEPLSGAVLEAASLVVASTDKLSLDRIREIWNGGGSAVHVTVTVLPAHTRMLPHGSVPDLWCRYMLGIPEVLTGPIGELARGLGLDPDVLTPQGRHVQPHAAHPPATTYLGRDGWTSMRAIWHVPADLAQGLKEGTWTISCLAGVERFKG